MNFATDFLLILAFNYTRSMRKIYTLILLGLLAVSAINAQQGYYRAIVYNYSDGEPIPGAEIFLDTSKSPLIVSDANGFLVVLMTSGKHSIRIVAKNKAEQTRQVTIKKDLILSESIFLFSESDDIVNCDSINSPKFSDKSFLNNSDTLSVNGNKIYAANAFLRIGFEPNGIRSTMSVILPVFDVLSAKEIEITKAYVSYNGMLYNTDEIVARSGLFKLSRTKDETVLFVSFESPPWTGENVDVILEIINEGKKQYLKYNNGISIYPSEVR